MEDRISELPDDVLQKILHLLPLQDALRTSVLSKRWRRIDIRSTFLGLRFRSRSPEIYNKSIRKKLRRSLYKLDKLLRLRLRGNDVSIEKFEVMISIRNFPRYSAEVLYRLSLDKLIGIPLQKKLNTWMSVVAKPGLSVLDLRMLLRKNSHYSIPLSTLAAAKSLKTLSLGGFEIMGSSSDRVDVSFPCLEQLSLEFSSLGSFVMEKLVKGSPSLEKLLLVACRFRSLKVEGLSRLKTLQVIHGVFDKIVIDAPCLRVLDICGWILSDDITLATYPRFLKQIKFGLAHLDSKSPTYIFEGTQLPIQEWFCRLVEKSRFLEHLTILGGIPTVKKIHIASTLHSLKTLNIRDVNMVSFEIVAPNLEKFYMVSRYNLPFIRLNASEQLEVELDLSDFRSTIEPDNEWYTRWAKFLSYFNHSRALKIKAFGGELFSIPKESRKDLPRSLFGVKSLELGMHSEWPRPKTFSHHIDYMLWLSPRATNLTLQSSSTGTEVVIKCLYDDTEVVDDNKDKCCEDCNLLELNCWRHSLSQVIIEKFEGDEMEKHNIKSFFQEHVNNLDYIEPLSDATV